MSAIDDSLHSDDKKIIPDTQEQKKSTEDFRLPCSHSVFSLYVCQRAHRDAFAAGTCGIHIQVTDHVFVILSLKTVAGELAAFEPPG
jgi:hypothetical protein